MKKMNRFLTLVCMMFLAMALFTGCSSKPAGESTQGDSAGTVSVDRKELLKSMYTSETELGLAGKYASVAEITDGKVDPDLVGAWKTSDESFTYEFTKEGTMLLKSQVYDLDEELPFTCIKVGDHKIICQDTTVTDYGEGDQEMVTQAIGFSTYQVGDGVLYLVSVDDDQDGITFTSVSLVTFYKADESGDISKSLADNPIPPESLYGDWTYDGGTITINEEGMKVTGGPEDLSKDPLPISFNDRGNLVVEARGTGTEYGYNLVLIREYEDDTRTKLEKEEYQVALFYEGQDADDRPNLEGLMTDWHKEYGYESYHYDFSFSSPVE